MYRLTTFHGVTLPIYNPETTLGTPPINNAFIETASGSFDSWGQQRSAYDFPYTLTYVSTILNKTDPVALRNQLDTLRSLVGVSSRLYRVADDNPSIIQWANARLMEAPSVRASNNNLHLEITFSFSVLEHWRSEQQWRFDDGTLFDNGRVFDEGIQEFTLSGASPPAYPHYFAESPVVVGGNVPIMDGFIQIEAGSTTYNSFTLYSANNGVAGRIWVMNFDRAGSAVLPAGSTMTIDCANFSIDIDGDPAYQYVNFKPHPVGGFAHQIDGWTWFSKEVGNGITGVVFDTPDAMGSDTVLRVRLLDQWL